MPRLLRLSLVFLLLLLPACNLTTGLSARSTIKKSMQSPAAFGPAHLDIHDGLPVLHLYGSHEEMGTQYGTLLTRPLRAFHNYLHSFVPSETIEKYLAYAKEHEANLPQPIRVELTAISNASGMPYLELVAVNVIPHIRCSTLAVWGGTTPDGQPADLVMGRNADYHTADLSDRGSLVVVYHPDTGHAVAAVTFLGMVGAYTGMNDQGVSFGNMLVFNNAGPDEQPAGVTVQIAQRLAAHDASSADQMADLLRGYTHVIPMNVMLADADKPLVLELGIPTVATRTGENNFLVSTNYFRTPALFDQPVACPRYDALATIGRQSAGYITVDQMKKALYAARIPDMNIQAAVFVPRKRTMHVSINREPASAGPYVILDQDTLFANPPRTATPSTSK